MSVDVYIIAEVGSVHDGSFGNALKLIETAAQCGADAVKFQTHIPDAETLQDAPSPSYFSAEPRFKYFSRTGFSESEWINLKAKADSIGIDFLSSPFSEAAVNLLEKVGVSKYKVPSGEITNLPMLEKIAQTNKPILLSSGMSSWAELDQAVNLILNKNSDLSVMQCSSIYPCPEEKVGLNVMRQMSERWRLPVGYSDHTLDNYACFAAVSMDAIVVEKHLTFSRLMYGSDAQHSAEPAQFKELVKGVRAISKMKNTQISKDDLGDYLVMKQTFEKSVVSRQEIPAGSTIEASMVTVKKPGTGIPSAQLPDIIGTKAKRTIEADRLLEKDDFE